MKIRIRHSRQLPLKKKPCRVSKLKSAGAGSMSLNPLARAGTPFRIQGPQGVLQRVPENLLAQRLRGLGDGGSCLPPATTPHYALASFLSLLLLPHFRCFQASCTRRACRHGSCKRSYNEWCTWSVIRVCGEPFGNVVPRSWGPLFPRLHTPSSSVGSRKIPAED